MAAAKSLAHGAVPGANLAVWGIAEAVRPCSVVVLAKTFLVFLLESTFVATGVECDGKLLQGHT